jgi:hypothetical protein
MRWAKPMATQNPIVIAIFNASVEAKDFPSAPNRIGYG